ncbi:ABC transporter permease [Bacillus sp. 1P02SD]|uniref:ABC transporter permease n=1 Tax=Bacillus sp. 1P02SD TaxID=3132264 RepID=UPI0039A105EC
MNANLSERIVKILSPIVLLLIWELCARMNWIDARFFPPPTKVIQVLFHLLGTGELWEHLSASLYRVLSGFAIGSIAGIILGIIMGMSRWVRAIVDPIIASLYPIPKSALVPLFLLIFGLGEASKVAIVTFGVFFLVLINTQAGVLQISKIHFDVGKNFSASRLRVFTTIALPGSLPLIITGLKLALGMGLVLVVVAEMVGAKSGIGYMIMNAWNIFAIEQMYVGLIITSILGYVSTLLLDEAERLLVPGKN